MTLGDQTRDGLVEAAGPPSTCRGEIVTANAVSALECGGGVR
jgi:hypothetical protein